MLIPCLSACNASVFPTAPLLAQKRSNMSQIDFESNTNNHWQVYVDAVQEEQHNDHENNDEEADCDVEPCVLTGGFLCQAD
jgi:hypothetical protein